MKNGIPILLILALLALAFPGRSQSAVEFSDPELSMQDGKVHIAYSMRGISGDESYSIRIIITRADGSLVPARALNGDIGPGISGEGKKLIIWDIEADEIFLDEDIFVEILGTAEGKPVSTVQESANQESKTPEITVPKEFSRTGLILQSVAFPGLGLSRLNPGKPHWIRGVAAYACLGTSVYMNRKAWDSYQDYLNPEDPAGLQDVFDQAYDQKKLSNTLAYAAIGIWVIDLAWTIIGTSGEKMNRQAQTRGLSLGTDLEPMSGVPVLALRYNF